MQTLWKTTLRKPLAIATLAVSALSPAPLLAQQEEDGAEEARAVLNSEQARMAREQLENNARSQADYERALAEVEAAKARIAADDEAAKVAYEAEKARIEAEYSAAMARWEADVAACQAGDFSRCARP